MTDDDYGYLTEDEYFGYSGYDEVPDTAKRVVYDLRDGRTLAEKYPMLFVKQKPLVEDMVVIGPEDGNDWDINIIKKEEK